MKKLAVLTCSLLVICLSETGYTDSCRKKLSGIIKRSSVESKNQEIGLIYNRNNEYTMTVLDEGWNVMERSLGIGNFNQESGLGSGLESGLGSGLRSGPVSHPGVIMPGQIVPAPTYERVPEVSGNERMGHELSFFSDEDGDLVGVSVVHGQLMFTYFRQKVDSYSGDSFLRIKILIN